MPCCACVGVVRVGIFSLVECNSWVNVPTVLVNVGVNTLGTHKTRTHRYQNGAIRLFRCSQLHTRAHDALLCLISAALLH